MMNAPLLDDGLAPHDGRLVVDEAAKGYLRETAKWGKFLAILGFIGAGFLVLAGLGMVVFGSALTASPELADTPFAGLGGLFGLLYFVAAAFYIFPSLYLYRFADRAKRAAAADNSPLLTDALGNLKSLYKFMGVLTAVFIGLYVLFFVLAIVGGGLAALAG